MSSAFTTLPLSLILLIHLRVLNYPFANEPQYDNNMFEARTKGLKDRVKMMEDICYFLVNQLEDNAARNILPMYPCSQPSDNLAFRTSLFKYLEALRHRALFSSSGKKPSTNSGYAQKNQQQVDSGMVQRSAWWWKDVMVRKSLLEECAGERFESLLVAFSAHVLLHKSRAYSQDQIYNFAMNASESYNATLLLCQSKRSDWLQRAQHLFQRRGKLDLLKRMILSKAVKEARRTASSEQVLSLAKVKYADVQNRLWSGEQGSAALVFLLRLLGSETPPRVDLVFQEAKSEGKPLELSEPQLPPRPPMLQLAAACYPTELKRLRGSVLRSLQNGTKNADMSDSAKLILSSNLAAIKAIHSRLSEALLRLINGRRQSRLLSIQSDRRAWGQFAEVVVAKAQDLLRKPFVDHALLVRFSLPDPASEDSIEQRIHHIRQCVLPRYPSPPDPNTPHMATQESNVLASQIPRLKAGTKAGTKATHTSISKDSHISTLRSNRLAKKPVNPIRESLVHNMIKHASNERKQTFDDEACKDMDFCWLQIISATEDDSTEDVKFKTPKSKAPPNRICTLGQKKTPGAAMNRPRKSFIKTIEEPQAKLPFVPATSTESMSLLGDQNDEGADDGTSEGDGERSQPSTTLRELLLAADTSAFALIDDEDGDYIEEFSGWE
ncbi:hypothetical protein AN958_07781 [Leucoagaricus sp. SymC.cos]|nr:hypothetical protein AN958_07781 [Leucoagaricus sp. SymC.cos]